MGFRKISILGLWIWAALVPALAEDAYWYPYGNVIRGEKRRDATGYSVDSSADGTIVAYGAIYASKKRGEAMVLKYDKEKEKWKQLGQLIKGDNKDDVLGGKVKLSANGKILAVSSHDFDDDRGYVKIFKYSEKRKKWKQLGSTIEGKYPDDGSGWGLSLSENGLIVAIGAYGNDDANAEDDDDDAGHTRIYKYSGSEKDWQQMGKDIYGDGDTNYDGSTVDLSANGKTVVIGGPYYLTSGRQYVGRVRVFTFKTKKGKWKQVGQDIIGDNRGKVGDEFGLAVSMDASGKTIAISAGCEYYCEKSVDNRVEIYSLDDNNWERIGDSIYRGEGQTEFASAVSLSADGKTVAFNARGDATSKKYYAYVYNLVDEESSDEDGQSQSKWSQLGNSILYKPNKKKAFDWHSDILALSSDGKTLVVGSTQKENSGSSVSVYQVF